MNHRAFKTIGLRVGLECKRHNGRVDYDLCNGDWFRTCITDDQFDAIVFEDIALHIHALNWRSGFEFQPASRGEEEDDHSSEEQDWDQQQAQGPEGEARR